MTRLTCAQGVARGDASHEGVSVAATGGKRRSVHSDGGFRAHRRAPMVFMSYRREDTGGYAGHLADNLVRHYGEENVFRDVDSVQPARTFTPRFGLKSNPATLRSSLSARRGYPRSTTTVVGAWTILVTLCGSRLRPR